MSRSALAGRESLRALGVLIGATGIAALVAWGTPGFAPVLRDWFAFAPASEPGGLAAALSVWLAKLRGLAPLLFAAGGARERGGGWGLGGVFGLVLPGN